jgi:hypothetical protein
MKSYRVNYRLYGSINVKASSREEAKDIVSGIIIEDREEATDADLYEGIYKAGRLGHPSFNIDGDAIEILEVSGDDF